MTVLVAHGSHLVAEGLAVAIGRSFEGQDVLLAGGRQQCIALAADRHPDAAAIDTELAPGSPSGFCEDIRRHGVPVVTIASAGRNDYVSLLDAGAQAIVLSDGGVKELLDALGAVLDGQAYVPPALLGTVLHDLVLRRRAERAPFSPIDRLTPRERDVFALLGAGADHREIAHRLLISPHTAKTHIHRLLIKLDVRSRIEAGALAVAHGVVLPEEGHRHG